jgi:hypothetical protein
VNHNSLTMPTSLWVCTLGHFFIGATRKVTHNLGFDLNPNQSAPAGAFMRAWTRAARPRLRLLSKGDTAHDRLDARNDVGLAKGPIQLGPRSRGWIDFDNFMSLFGTGETYLPPSEWDPDGQREVSEFALASRRIRLHGDL